MITGRGHVTNFSKRMSKYNVIFLAKQKEIAARITKKLKKSFDLERKAKEKWRDAKNTFERPIIKEIAKFNKY